MSPSRSRPTLIGEAHPTVEGAPRATGLLVIVSPEPQLVGTFFELAAPRTVIGRDRGADIRVDDEGVSRRHVCIERREGGEYSAVDLSSTNGTWLNGVRVRSAVLADGDLLQIGTGTKLRFGPRPEKIEPITASQVAAVPSEGAFEYDAVSRRFSIMGGIAGIIGPETSAEEKRQGALGRVHEADRQPLREGLDAALGRGECELDFRVVGPHGEIAWVRLCGRVWRDGSGSPVRIAGSASEITERNRAEAELRRHPLCFNSQSDAVTVVGLDGAIRDWNPSAERLFGWLRAEVLGQRPGALLHTDPADGLERRASAAIASGEGFEFTNTLTRKDGLRIEIQAIGVPLRDPDGGTRSCVLLLRDDDQRRRALAQAQVTERLASMGTLAAGVAHEVNNPLAFIGSNLAFVRERLTEVATTLGERYGPMDESLADCMEGIERIRVIVRDLKAFSRGGDGESEPIYSSVDINKAVQFALRVADGEARRSARVVKELGAVPAVIASEAQLGQVFLNLVLNAAQAIPPGRPSEHRIRVTSRFEAASGLVVVEVADTGAGIRPEHLRRIFEPFYTTKPEGVGTGLGLFVCQGIVAALGGEISAQSTMGSGTTFRVALPAAKGQALAPAGAEGRG
jgi:PAS domain S-box-containing protein